MGGEKGQRGGGRGAGERERQERQERSCEEELASSLSLCQQQKERKELQASSSSTLLCRFGECVRRGGAEEIWVGEGGVVASGGNRDYGMGKKGFFLSICCCLLSQLLLQCCFSPVFVKASTGAEEVFRGRPEQGLAWELPIRPSDCDPYTLVTNPPPPPPPSPSSSSSSSSSDKPHLLFRVCVCVCVCVCVFLLYRFLVVPNG